VCRGEKEVEVEEAEKKNSKEPSNSKKIVEKINRKSKRKKI
jgi:hypothetical protein